MTRSWHLLRIALLAALPAYISAAQSTEKPAPDPSAAALKATKLAENGHCVEALPALRKSLGQLKDKELRRKVSLNGVRCAMTLRQTDSALTFLSVLSREFPNDPDALYAAIHAYSDLSTISSQELARNAPSSFQAHELLAESYESQEKWQDAEKEYRRILKEDPKVPGIHFRLGRLLLSKPNPGPEIANEAKQEFEQELQIDPSNAGAEYVLGELARQSQQWDDAVEHFSRAAKLDPNFGEAFLGLGSVLVSQRKYAEAIPPLEKAAKLDPQNAAAHYHLALAYSRTGRKEDGDREFAIQQRLTQKGAAGEPTADPQPKPNE